MATTSPRQTVSSTSSEMFTLDAERLSEVEMKHKAVSDFLEAHGFDALVLEHPGNFAWFTLGADCACGRTQKTTAALFLTADARVIVTNNVDSPRLFERELPGLGFQVKERPWYEPRQALLDDLCRGRKVASDTGFGSTTDVSVHLTRLRLPLLESECVRARELGADVVHAVEATARQCRPGCTEADLAGEVAHRMIRRNVWPERIQVTADGGCKRYRHWTYSDKNVQQYCSISAVGRRGGLCIGTARTFCFGEPPQDFRAAYQRAMLVHATGMYFSQPDWELHEIWKRIERIYEKFGCPGEWRHATQGEITGFEPGEVPIVPKSEFRLASGMPVYWHPSVGPAIAGDTILTAPDGFKLLTARENWPKLTIEVKGASLHCPDILHRELVNRPALHHDGDSVFELDMLPGDE